MAWRLSTSGTYPHTSPTLGFPRCWNIFALANSSRRHIAMFGKPSAMSGRTRSGQEKRSITRLSSPDYNKVVIFSCKPTAEGTRL